MKHRMSRWRPVLPQRLALCACLLLTSTALATAPEESPPPADVAAQSEPPPLVPATEPPESEQDAPRGEVFPRTPQAQEARPQYLPVGRMMLELLGGAAGGIAGVYLGYFFVVSVERDQPGVIGKPQQVLNVVELAGLGLGSSLGVYGVGTLAGGQGSYWKTLLGSSLGTLLGALAILAIGENTGTAMVTLASATVGGIIAFEMSHSDGTPAPETFARTRNNSRTKQVRLVFAANPRGQCFGGLVGSF